MDTRKKIAPIAAKVLAVLGTLPGNKYSYQSKKLPVLTIEGVEHMVVSVGLIPGSTLRFVFMKDDPCGYASVAVNPEIIDNLAAKLAGPELEDHLDYLDSLHCALNLVLDERNRARTDSICSIAVKLAELLWKDGGKGDIAFDPRSYDNPEDIPYIVVAGKRHDILSLNINEDGSNVTVTTYDSEKNTYWDYSFYTDFIYDTDHEFADNVDDYETVLENMGVRELFCDAYYETEDSWKIGDFETDFLKIR